MAGSPSLPIMDYNELSSPDPLATSTNDPPVASSPSKPRRMIRHKQSLSQSSRASASFSQQFNLPARTMTDKSMSPWNIRVTVEAEPEIEMDQETPRFLTRTTKISLKESSPEPLRDTRIKPSIAKSGSPSRSRRRSTTPAGEMRRRQSVTDLDVVVLGDNADEDEWCARGASPRKRKATARRKGRKAADSVDENVDPGMNSDATVEILSESPKVRQLDVNKVSVRRRADSVKQPVSDIPLPTIELPPPSRKSMRELSTNSTRSYPTPSPTPSDQEDALDAFDTIMESEGFTMIDLDSITSVKQLRSSPANDHALVEDVEQIAPEVPTTVSNTATERIEYPSLPGTSSNITTERIRILDGMTSSPPIRVSQVNVTSGYLRPPVHQLRKVTPTIYTSPKLPSPPRASSIERSAPNSVETLKATKVLQGALDAGPRKSVLTESLRKDRLHTRSSSDELFEGYDSRTQREMRAGLRFGEELAKRRPALSINLESFPETDLTVEDASSRNSINQGILNSPSKEYQHDDTLGTELPDINYSQSKPHMELSRDSRTARSSPNSCRDEQRELEREREWQCERDAVVQAINEASPDEVIVIDSDEEEESTPSADTFAEDDGGDIWLAEAKDSSSSPRTHEMSSPRDQPELSVKTKRQPIPSPWKRGDQASGNESTVLTNGEGESAISGLFWKETHDNETKFGAKQLKKIRYELKNADLNSDKTKSGSFDLEKMMSPMKRFGESTRNAEESFESTLDSDSPSAVSQEKTPSDLQQNPSPQQNVNLEDDDFESSAQHTPERDNKYRTGSSPSLIRPSFTPRSALKGTRPSLGDTESSGSNTDLTSRAPRNVVWARRSTHVDEDWIESSRSVNTDESSTITIVPQNDGPTDRSDALESDWQATSKHATSSTPLSETAEQERNRPRSKTFGKLPSYLRPPSYPSDPTRSSSRALNVGGDFSDTHFRTLHIIYRKAQRPRFHAPALDELRPQIKKLIDQRWTLNVDEDHAGLGGFKFKFGEREGRVLERFCREVELGHIEDVEAKLRNLTEENGMWGGIKGCDHGKGFVTWEWTCKQLATWLGRIVIGEVVRDEEYQGRK